MNLERWLLVLLLFAPGLVVADVEVCADPESDFGGENGTPQLLTSAITVTDNFIIEDLQVVVDITHPFVGDLVIDLFSPSGTSLRLHDGDGGDADNLQVIYSDDGVANGSQSYVSGCYMQPSGGELATFDGEQVAGLWTLAVFDSYPSNNDGTLESWCLRGFEAPTTVTDPCAVPPVPEPKTPIVDRVVLVLVDGLRYTEGLGHPTRQYVPNMDTLAQQGVIIEPFLNDGNTVTIAGIPAIMNGSWAGSTPFFDPDCQQDSIFSNTPYVQEYVRRQLGFSAQDCAYVLGPVCPWRGSFHPSYGPDYWPQWIETSGGDDANWLVAQNLIATTKPRFLTFYLPSVDSAGHSGDWDAYLAAIENADSIIGELWTTLQSDPDYADNTVMLITNDHGRHTTNFQGHGDGCNGCRQIECLAIGPGIRTGLISTIPRTTPDIAPTLARLLGAEAQFSSGEIMTEILEPGMFLRGDANMDGALDLADVVTNLGVLFQGMPSTCHAALDNNDDNSLDVADPIHLLTHLFQGGPLPSLPYPNCGVDPTGATLGCAGHLRCD